MHQIVSFKLLFTRADLCDLISAKITQIREDLSKLWAAENNGEIVWFFVGARRVKIFASCCNYLRLFWSYKSTTSLSGAQLSATFLAFSVTTTLTDLYKDVLASDQYFTANKIITI